MSIPLCPLESMQADFAAVNIGGLFPKAVPFALPFYSPSAES